MFAEAAEDYKYSDKGTVWVILLAKSDGAVHSVILAEDIMRQHYSSIPAQGSGRFSAHCR